MRAFKFYSIVLLIFTSCTKRDEVTHDIIIKNITIISPHLNKAIDNATVVIDSGQIKAIKTGDFLGKAHQIIQGKGKYLIPGLIDSHVHVGGNGGLKNTSNKKYKDIRDQFLKQEPKSYLYHGFTTLIDMNKSDRFTKVWNEKKYSPNLKNCRTLPFTNGYGMVFEPEEFRFESDFLYDSNQADKIPSKYKKENHTPKAVVDRVANETEAICVKTFCERGFAGIWNWPVPTSELLAQVSKEAKKNNLIHLIHANTYSAYVTAVEANVNVMAHGLWDWEDYNNQKGIPQEIKTLLNSIITSEIYVQSTARVIFSEKDVFDREMYLKEKALKKILPKSLLSWYNTDEGGWFRKDMIKRIEDNPQVAEHYKKHSGLGELNESNIIATSQLGKVTKYLADNNGLLIIGSDTPVGPNFANPPGYNGYMEMVHLNQMGVELKKILQGATINNAKAFGLDNIIGTIEENKKADLLVLNQNPWKSIKAYNDIHSIIVNGSVVNREALSAERE